VSALKIWGGLAMKQLLYYAAITCFGTISAEVIILLFRSKTVEQIILNERKEHFVNFARVMILVFGISLILYHRKDSSFDNVYAYGFTLLMSLLLTITTCSFAIWIMINIGTSKNYFIEDEEYGKLYLVRNSSEKFIYIAKNYILLSDRPKVTDSKIVLFKGGTDINQKKIYTEPKRLSMGYKGIACCERKETV
jgi:hypothetical protein